MRYLAVVLALISFNFTACSVNPVTGKKELVLMSSAQQIEMGRQNYAPMQQSQGGQYDVDPALTRYVNRVGASVLRKAV